MANYPFPKLQILNFCKLKEFADINFKFDKKWQKVLQKVENTAGKGEIARYEQFFLFPQCYQKICIPDVKISTCLRKGYIGLQILLAFSLTFFYAHASKDPGHIILSLSVCPCIRPSVCLHKLNMKT